MTKTSPRKRAAAKGAHRRRSGAAQARRLLRELYANVRGGMWTAAFRAPAARAWNATPVQLILIVMAALVAVVVLQRTFYGLSAEFNWYGLRGQWLDLPTYLLAGWLAARFAARAVSPLIFPIALYTAGILIGFVIVLLVQLAQQLPETWSGRLWLGAYYGGTLWFLAAAAFLFRRTARLAWGRVAVALAPLVLLTVYAVAWPPAPLWYEPTPAPTSARASAPRDSPVDEELLYLQPRLTRETLAAIAAQRPGVPDLYFVGFAPYAGEDVFLKESEVIRTLLDRRFDTAGRSVLLVNNDDTLRDYPLATVTNLRAALEAIGERIDPEEDVVLLYLTSHGSEDHRLVTRYWPLRLTDLEPQRLRAMLDDAGIRWRVIAVSACYSGGFIEPLEGPATLVMTAASATRTSFGCGAASDFTWFGQAVFHEQLRETYSFEQAFERALPVIREREQAQGFEYSDPQIAVGDAIRARLAALERRLQALASR